MTTPIEQALPTLQTRTPTPPLGHSFTRSDSTTRSTTSTSEDAGTETPQLEARVTWSKHPLFADKVRGLRLRAIRCESFNSLSPRRIPLANCLLTRNPYTVTSSWFSVVMYVESVESLESIEFQSSSGFLTLHVHFAGGQAS